MNKFMVILVIGFVIASCDGGPNATRGFRLPEGSVSAGEKLFETYDCVACHTIEGIQNGERATLVTPPIQLGGEVARSKTYASLLTSVVNPSHRISPDLDKAKVEINGISIMAAENYNDIMTVADLIDIVTFLQTKYQLVEPPHSF